MTATVDRLAVAVIALGGGLGSVARYGVSRAWPAGHEAVPWATLSINVLGSLLLGMLVVAVTEIWRPHRLIRPMLGTGVLGGYTTFSTFAVEARGLPAQTAALYVALSVIGGVAAAVAGMTVVRQLEPRFQIAASHEQVDDIDPDLP
jgi:fluoride exporter